MNKKKVLSVFLAVILIITMLPAMVFGEAQEAKRLGGRLKIKGTPAVGSALGADYEKVEPTGVTDDSVTFQWFRNSQGVLYEVGQQNTYQITEDDLGCTLILVITGKAEAGLSGSLTADTESVAATPEEVVVPEGESADPAEEQQIIQLLENTFGNIWNFSETEPADESEEVLTEELVEEEPTEELVEEEPTEEFPEGISEEIIEEYPEETQEDDYTQTDSDTDNQEYEEEYEDILEIPEENIEELVIPSDETEEIPEEPVNEEVLEGSMDPLEQGIEEAAAEGIPVYEAAAFTEDGTGVLDFGFVQSEGEMPAQYITVTNTGNQPLNFVSISPEHFMVQDITETLAAGESVSLWIQPRQGQQPGEYQDTIVYTSIEGAQAVFEAKVSLESQASGEEAGEPTTEPGEPTTEPGEPTTEPGEPTTEPGEPTTEPGEPTTEPGEPTTEPGEPTTEPGEPTTEPPAPVISVGADQTEFDFGTVTEGYTEVPSAQSVTLTNTGTERVIFSQVSSQNFEISELTELAVNESCTMAIRPKAGLVQGDYTEVLRVNDKDGVPLQEITVYFTVERAPAVYGAVASPESLAFGNKESGYTEASAAQTVTVTNTGNTAIHLEQPTAASYVIGTLSKTVLEAGESGSFTVQPKAGLEKGDYTEDIAVPNQEGISISVDAHFTVTKTVVKLTSVHSAADITGLKNGTAKSARALGLPDTVNIETTNGTMKAGVTWDVKGCSYDPKSADQQTFTVKGAVKLPDGIKNPDGVALETSVKVTVGAYTPKLASSSGVDITGIGADVRYTTETKISFTAAGSGMDNNDPGKGDTRYIPRIWHVLEDRTWDSAPYTAVFRMGVSGNYTLTVKFFQQKFDGSNWVDTGEKVEKSIDFTVAKAQVSTQSVTPTPVQSNRINAVMTGDYTNILMFVVLLGAAVICIAAIVVYLRKKRK